jgi:putative membrane protein
MTDTWMWVLAAHLIGVFLWIGGLFTTYWLLRIHANAPKDVHDKLTLMERSLALMMDIAATLAIGTGLYLAFSIHLFTMPKQGWLHAKIAIVVLGIISVHGLVRAKVGKFSRGQTPNVPQWPWSLLLAALCAIVILVVKKPF